MSYTVVTNNHPRRKTYGFELPTSVRDQFDYLSDDEFQSREFVQYRGAWFDLGDVAVAPDSIKALGYDGFNSDTYFSGVAFKYFTEDGYELDESVIVASIAILD